MELINLSNINYFHEGEKLFSIKKISIDSNEKVALIGKNGSGKSTLAKMIVGERKHSNIQRNKNFSIGYLPQLNNDPILSGGEIVKQSITQLFKMNHDFFILDEPTASLDLKNRKWLLNELKNLTKGVLIISHDWNFIDSFTKDILYFEDKEMLRFNGSIEELQKSIENNKKKQLSRYNENRKEIRKLEREARKKKEKAKQMTNKKKTVSRSDWKVNSKLGRYNSQSKALNKSASSIEKRIERIAKEDKPNDDPNLKLKMVGNLKEASYTLISLKPGTVSVGGNQLFSYPTFKVRSGDHMVLTGDNGTGKTTFFEKLLNKELENGYYAKNLSIGYFSQNTVNLEMDKSILENVEKHSKQDITTILNLLAGLGFDNDRVMNKVSLISGGEMARVELCKILLGNYNLLLMDEPTNYLDIHMIMSLKKFIISYPGSIIIISHDETIINSVPNRWNISSNQLLHSTKEQKTKNNDELVQLLFQKDLLIQNEAKEMGDIKEIQDKIDELKSE